MAKGKHAPAPGAVRPDKVIHPHSRKAARMHSKELRQKKLATTVKAGGQRLQALGEKLAWFKETLPIVLAEEETPTRQTMLALAKAFLTRFHEELQQIDMKNSVGGGAAGGAKRRQHQSRKDVIEHTARTDAEEFDGCGLEMPDLLDAANFKYFSDWNGELRFAQNIKVRRFTRKQLEAEEDLTEKDPEVEDMNCM